MVGCQLAGLGRGVTGALRAPECPVKAMPGRYSAEAREPVARARCCSATLDRANIHTARLRNVPAMGIESALTKRLKAYSLPWTFRSPSNALQTAFAHPSKTARTYRNL